MIEFALVKKHSLYVVIVLYRSGSLLEWDWFRFHYLLLLWSL
jgi:hypothetical protein